MFYFFNPTLAEAGDQTTTPRPPRSSRQQEASRANGARSRGPVTTEGKSKSRLNAIKHGLFVKVMPARKMPLIVDREEFDALKTGIFADIKPVGALETNNAELLCVELYKLRCLKMLEMEILEGPPHGLPCEDQRQKDLRDELFDGKSRQEIESITGGLLEFHKLIAGLSGQGMSEDAAMAAAREIFSCLTHCTEIIPRLELDIKRLVAELDTGALGRQQALFGEIEQRQLELEHFREQDLLHGLAAHGVVGVDDILEIAQRDREIPPEKLPVWLETLTGLAGLWAEKLSRIDDFDAGIDERKRLRITHMGADLDKLNLIAKYETTCQRSISRLLSELRTLREERQTGSGLFFQNPSDEGAVVDVSDG